MFEGNPFLQTLRPIWQNPKLVFVDERRLRELARELNASTLDVPAWRIPFVVPDHDDQRFIEYLGWVTSVNFAFTGFEPPHYDYTTRYPGLKIKKSSIALGAAFMRSFGNSNFAIADIMADATHEQVKDFFAEFYPIPLLDLRVSILREVGQILNERFDGGWAHLFEEAGWKVFGSDKEGGVADLLILHFPSYRDESFHFPSRSVLKFYKRAQLLPMIYQGRALNSRGCLRLLDGADDIGPIADYAIPAALRELGVLIYTPEIAKVVDTMRIIPKDSLAEQEIRAQMSYAMVRLVEEINKLRKAKDQINILALDNKMWVFGHKTRHPHHLTPTTCY